MIKEFENLGIGENILKVIEKKGFKAPTKIQNKALPYVNLGRDVIVTAATGSGKTLIYAIRLIQNSTPKRGVQGLVIVPTRELAIQVGDVLREFAQGSGLNIMVSYGGGSIKSQKEELPNVDILIGTPGRISDYVEQDLFELGRIKTLVLDEVDAMSTSQFRAELDYILQTTPKKKQTIVFSATISKDIYLMLKPTLNDPVRVSVEAKVSPKKLKQVFYEVEQNQKLSLLAYLLQTERIGLAIVFVNRQDVGEFIAKNLKFLDLKIKVIHGDMSQGKRNKIIDEFRCEKFDVLVTTDVAARGLDVENVTHIFNYNIAEHSEKYIHRIGRCARAGASGKVINLISKKDEVNFLQIIKDYKIQAGRRDLPQFEPVEIKFELKKKKPKRKSFE